MSNPIQTPPLSSPSSSSSSSKTKRRKRSPQQSLIPGLPDHIAQLCLSRLNAPSLIFSVSRSWRRLLYHPSFPPFLSLYALFSSFQTDQFDTNPIRVLAFDPLSSTWSDLPPPPSSFSLRLMLRHPAFISRNLPIQSVSAAGKLVLLAATDGTFLPALSRPLCFHPQSPSWDFGPPIDTPRRWCAAGVCGGAVYLASGMGSHFSYDVARSVEKWELNLEKLSEGRISEGKWERVRGLKDGRFCRDAIDAVGWKGKLCIGTSFPREGAIYDPEMDTWQEMPKGMAAGWRGPVAALDEEVMYTVDDAKGVLRKYDPVGDYWEDVVESDRLKGARHISAAGGRVCVVCGGGGGGGGEGSWIAVVDAVSPRPERVWVVDSPPGLEAVSVHVLPRICGSDPE